MLHRDELSNNIFKTLYRIQQAALIAERECKNVRLVLATKTQSIQTIEQALEILFAIKNKNLQNLEFPLEDSFLTQLDFIIAENKVQELFENINTKSPPYLDIQKHFIGHLQTNKIKEVLKFCTSLQSLDSLKLANSLQQKLEIENRVFPVYLQINSSYEKTKFGFLPEAALSVAQELSRLKNLKITGLMTIGANTADKSLIQASFVRLIELKKQLDAQALPNFALKNLSFGMSSDLELAIELGATEVRMGSAIFGQR